VTKITAKPKANPSTRGNAKVNSKVGQDNGTAAGKKAQSSAQKGQAKQVGQGAERTYKRKVLRKIARVPKKRTGAKGLALVGMVIAADGRIASVGIVRSSGHSGIDQMAIETVRRARGFDPTPTGARMKLVVEMKSKG
jgi:protein TonB